MEQIEFHHFVGGVDVGDAGVLVAQRVDGQDEGDSPVESVLKDCSREALLSPLSGGVVGEVDPGLVDVDEDLPTGCQVEQLLTTE